MFFFSLYFLFPCKDPGLHENVETKPRETEEPEAEDDLSDVPDNELGAVVEFDEDELDEAQTEADVKNITTKHQITIEELKREVLGSVKKKRFLHKVVFCWDQPYNRNRFRFMRLFFNRTLFRSFSIETR